MKGRRTLVNLADRYPSEIKQMAELRRDAPKGTRFDLLSVEGEGYEVRWVLDAKPLKVLSRTAGATISGAIGRMAPVLSAARTGGPPSIHELVEVLSKADPGELCWHVTAYDFWGCASIYNVYAGSRKTFTCAIWTESGFREAVCHVDDFIGTLTQLVSRKPIWCWIFQKVAK